MITQHRTPLVYMLTIHYGKNCLHNEVADLWSLLRNIMHNLQYCLHAVLYFAQPKICVQ